MPNLLYLRYTDDLWRHPRGLIIDLGQETAITAENLASKIIQDDPLRRARPAVRILVGACGDDPVMDLCSMTAQQQDTEFSIGEDILETVIERKVVKTAEENLSVPEPVVLELQQQQAASLILTMPTTSAGPRKRNVVRSESEIDKEQCCPMGLRYFDTHVGGFVRVPHGGDLPLDNHLRIAIELTPHAKSTHDTEQMLLQKKKSQALKLEHEENLAEEKYTGLLIKKDFKNAVRQGVPTSQRGGFYKTVLHREENSTGGKKRIFKKEFDATFQWDNLLEKYPTFSPKAPLFGAKQLMSAYHELTTDETRRARYVLSVIAHQHPHLRYFPILPTVACFLIPKLADEDTFVALNHIIASPSPNLPNYHIISDTAAVKKQLLHLIKAKLPQVFLRITTKSSELELGKTCLSWVESLFTNVLPLYMSVRLFDVYLSEGVIVLFRMTISLLKYLDSMNVPPDEYCTSAVKDADKLFSSAFNLSLSKKEVFVKEGSYLETSSDNDVDITGSVTVRPKIEGKSNILKDPQLWENLLSWIPSCELYGSWEKVYEKNSNGKSLATLSSSLLPYSGSSCVVLIHALPDHSGPKRLVQNEVFGYYISGGLVMSQKHQGGALSFPFTLSPEDRRYSSPQRPHAHFPSASSLSLGNDNGSAWLLFSDTDKGQSCIDSKHFPAVCQGKFVVINMEVYVTRQ
eukprot:TRINITY_DN11193_c0_g1_i1.p1 TRINITY_DN11193_c0_g1~~TRINITY_DN11193_c0_g1_i1.p1  ORF type:complete len:695 (+),score=85.65 TRINITY_DN11193_c0_g1_i1:23-2086(+)